MPSSLATAIRNGRALAPTIEEDISFSSMAQDKIGHALALYNILHEQFGQPHPDKLGFQRSASDFRCCHLVELPIGEYDFSLVRHFLFDHAELLRYTALQQSTFMPLAQLSAKVKGEIKYHVLHADVWVTQLGKSPSEEARSRMQRALDFAFPYALGIFEPNENDEQLITEGLFIGETALQQQWLETIKTRLDKAGLNLPQNAEPKYGGRKGQHTEYLAEILLEMTEVYRLDESAEW